MEQSTGVSSTDKINKEENAVAKVSAPNEKADRLKQWYLDYIDYFREKFSNLTDEEQKCVSNSKNFLPPCQIELFWLDNPSSQLIIQSNIRDEKDREIRVHGPYRSGEFLGKVGPILNEDRLQNRIEREPHPYNERETYAEEYAAALHGFIEGCKNALFQPRSDGGYSYGFYLAPDIWFQAFSGNIGNLDYKKEVEQAITQIKDAARRKNTEIFSPPVATNRPFNGYGAHLYPPIIVGKKTKPTLEMMLLHGNASHFSFDEKVLETKIDGKIVVINDNGYVFVQGDNKSECLKLLNLVMVLGHFHDLALFAVKEHELSQASLDEKHNITSMQWNPESIRSLLFYEKFGGHRSYRINKIEVPREKLEGILNDVKFLIDSEKLSEELRLFGEANTHLANTEWSQSFIMSWSIIERHYSDLWRKKLDHKDVDGERLGKLTSSAQWSIDSILEVLNLNGEVDDENCDLLMELKKKRNRFYHRGKKVSKEDSERCLAYARKILVLKISNLKGLAQITK